MHFVGVDLAWGQNRPTGVASLDDRGRLVHLSAQDTDESILAALAAYVDGPCLVAFDAPLVVTNPTGNRPGEQALNRDFARFDAGAHPSNTAKKEFAQGPRGGRLAAALELDMDPESRSARRAIEVYPHPATVSLFRLGRTLKYKNKQGRPLPGLRQELQRLVHLLDGLGHADPPLDLHGHGPWAELRAAIDAAATKSDLRRAEDQVDAVVCAYVAMFAQRRPELTTTYGDLATGYIVTPTLPEGHRPSPRLRAQPVPTVVEPVETQPPAPAVEPAPAVVEPAPAVVEPTTPVVEPTTPVVEPTTPVVEPVETQPTTPAARPTTPAVETPPDHARMPVRHAVQAYASLQPELREATDRYVALVVTLLDDAGINYLSVTGRAKSVASFAAKADRSGTDGRPVFADPLKEITDQIGIRVITYLRSDVAAVADVLGDQLAVLDDRDMGRETANEGRFGYASRHLLVRLDADRQPPAYDGLRGRRAQIQVRTILQHAWAEFEHAIRYKGTIPEEHAPDLDRRFTLAAGLLELADREFSLIRDRVQASVADQRPEPDASDPRISGSHLATFLAGQYTEAGWSREDHYTWVSGLLLELGITSLDELAGLLTSVDSTIINERLGYRYPPGAVRRLDDALLAIFGERYVALHGNAHRVPLLRTRLERLSTPVERSDA